MNDKISVIVPIYKVEQYLNRCIESIVNQTYRNLEIILVDDGSPDQCPKMCDDWAEKDARIVVIHKENGGLSDARNAGMKIATGEYIFFVDSDDWIHRETLEILILYQKEQNANVVECKALPVDSEFLDKKVVKEELQLQEFNSQGAMTALLRENPLKQTVWNKLYKRELIQDIFFEVGKYHEDEFWTYQVFDKVTKLIYVDVQLYYYFQRSDSIMGQAFSLKRLDAIEGRYRRLELIKDKYPELVSEAKENLAFLIMYYGQKALKTNSKDKFFYFEIVESFLKKLNLLSDGIQRVSVTHKIWIIGAEKNLKLTCYVRNMMRIN